MKLTAYHGTNIKFSQFDGNKARIMDDYYGGGIAYFTDNETVARSYAKNNTKKLGGIPYIYEVNLNLKKVFDIDHEFTGKELTKFFDTKTLKDFVIASGLVKLHNQDELYTIMVRLEEGRIKLKGDIIFKAISNGMTNTSKARKKLESLGYNSLRYNGGIQSQSVIKHNVYCMYHPQDIKIIKLYKLVKSPIKENIEIPSSSINLSRDHLPQINDDWLRAFLRKLKSDEINYEEESVPVKNLRPTQSDKEYNIQKLINRGKDIGKKPIMISADNYILDGHHRWAQQLNINTKSRILAIRVDLPILDLMNMARSFGNVSYKKINEAIKKTIRDSHKPKLLL